MDVALRDPAMLAEQVDVVDAGHQRLDGSLRAGQEHPQMPGAKATGSPGAADSRLQLWFDTAV